MALRLCRGVGICYHPFCWITWLFYLCTPWSDTCFPLSPCFWFLILDNPPRGYGVGKPSLGHACHVGDLFRVQRIPKRMIECGLWWPQVIPRVKIVFGRKSLDDVIPGSWYIIPLPSLREVAIGYNPSGSFILWGFWANDCLLAVLSEFKLTLLMQRSVCDGCSVDLDEELTSQVPDKVATKGRTYDGWI